MTRNDDVCLLNEPMNSYRRLLLQQMLMMKGYYNAQVMFVLPMTMTGLTVLSGIHEDDGDKNNGI